MNSTKSLSRIVMVCSSACSLLHGADPQSLDRKLHHYLKEFDLPAIAAAVFKGGEIVASGTAGTRRAGSSIPVKIDDRFHIASCSKAFTALIAGQLVDAGKLQWNTTIAEIFPELLNGMDAELGKVTMQQLLSHSSGLADDPLLLKLMQASYQQEGNMDQVRYWMVKQTASKPLDHARGSKFDYSNLGYIIAGSILERIGKKTWEEMVQEQIIAPMGLKTAGFGPQSSLGKVDAPLGHVLVNGVPKAMLAGPNGDSPVIVGPAGTLHLSILDFAKWVSWHAAEGGRLPALVSQATAKKLHTPVIDTGVRENVPVGTPTTGKYALGWGQVKYDWAVSPALTHTGSNNMNFASATFWVDLDFGFVMTTNIAGPDADKALNKLGRQLYDEYSGTIAR